jgi:hypothetical protein
LRAGHGRRYQPVVPRLLAAVAIALLLVPPAGAEFVARAKDFRCLTDGAAVPGRGFFVFHKNRRKLRKAVRIATRDVPGKRYPVGTIVQLFPFEAMVKRGGRFNRDGHGWEFFRLRVSAEGTEIVQRGGGEVENLAGSCQGCHMTGSAPDHDLVCEGHGAVQLPLGPDLIRALQADPRCGR